MKANWGVIDFDWNHIRSFLAVMETGSISSAAQVLGQTQPTISRQLAALEAKLGLVLFERQGRGLSATPAATKLLESAQGMANSAAEFALRASGSNQQIAGEISLACTEADAFFRMPELLQSLRESFPAISVKLVVSNGSSDLLRREADIAIRAFRPVEPDLIIRKLGDFEAALYATPKYLASIADIEPEHKGKTIEYIGFDAANNSAYINALNEQGYAVSSTNFPIMCNSHLTLWNLCKQGLGVGVMSTDIGDKEPEVVRLAGASEVFKGEFWLVSHRELRTNLRVRTVFDFIYKQLSKLDGDTKT